MSRSLRQAAGSLLVVGVGGQSLTPLECSWMRLVRPGGVILFRRNIEAAAQTRALLQSATELCAPHGFRCVDVEGGTVDRLREALAALPSAQAVALADRLRARKKTPLARRHGELAARAVRAFGFNTTLAPVLDLALPISASVMGSRTAGGSAAEVVNYGREFLAGLKRYGVTGCGKHFPGLGGGALDSHLETPRIERAWKELWREDLEPYRALREDLPMAMINHAAYPNCASKALPASVSRFWMTSVLRQRIGYKGLIFSDDFEMGGILQHMPIEEAAVAALRAGMDTIEICHSAELILRAYEAILTEAERSAAFARLLLARAKFVAGRRDRLFAEGVGRPLTDKQLGALREEILRFAAEVASCGEGGAQ